MEEIKTTAEQLRLELMEKCSCPNNQQVMFRCSDEQCPNRNKQQFYCSICLNENHKHMPLVIHVELDKQSKTWNEMKIKVTNSFPKAEKLYIKY